MQTCVISLFKPMGEGLKGAPRNSSGVHTLKEMQRTDCVSEDLPGGFQRFSVPSGVVLVDEGAYKVGRYSRVWMATV